MLKMKDHLATLAAITAISLVSQPAFAQFEPAPPPSDMDDVGLSMNISDSQPEDMPGFLDSDNMSMAFNIPLPGAALDVGAMRGCPVGGKRGGSCPLNLLSGENAVSDEQYESLYELKNKVLDQVGPKMLELATANRHLRDALTQETIDEKAASKLQKQISSLKADLETIKLNGKMDMMQILTGAQRKELRKEMVQGPKAGGGMRRMMKRMIESRRGGDR